MFIPSVFLLIWEPTTPHTYTVNSPSESHSYYALSDPSFPLPFKRKPCINQTLRPSNKVPPQTFDPFLYFNKTQSHPVTLYDSLCGSRSRNQLVTKGFETRGLSRRSPDINNRQRLRHSGLILEVHEGRTHPVLINLTEVVKRSLLICSYIKKVLKWVFTDRQTSFVGPSGTSKTEENQKDEKSPVRSRRHKQKEG